MLVKGEGIDLEGDSSSKTKQESRGVLGIINHKGPASSWFCWNIGIRYQTLGEELPTPPCSSSLSTNLSQRGSSQEQ